MSNFKTEVFMPFYTVFLFISLFDSIELLQPTQEIPPPPDVTGHKNLHLLPKECGLIDIGDKIRNGKDAAINEFPWMALLSYMTSDILRTGTLDNCWITTETSVISASSTWDPSGNQEEFIGQVRESVRFKFFYKGPEFQCGGTIINDRYILTAAHCVVNTYPLIGVRVGEYDLSSKIDCQDGVCLPSVQDLEIEKVIYPPDYNVTLYANDIALLRVSKINLKADNAKPLCLPTTEEINNLEYNAGVITGWGFTDPYSSTTDILQKVVLKKQDLDTCINAYQIQPATKLSYKQICAGGAENKDACRGDSGGPFHVASYFNNDERYVQYGIVSFGPIYCGKEGIPGVYTSVPYYMQWILDKLEP